MKAVRKPIGVIDIFAGPGGLGEGFSSFNAPSSSKHFPFELAVSAEMEKSAHATLLLRAFYRLLRQRGGGKVHEDYYNYLERIAKGIADAPAVHFGRGRWSELWHEAEQEALNLTLGEEKDNLSLFQRIEQVKDRYEKMILIGGPPCQAYSVVGRARQRHVEGFSSKGDKKHFLYKQYLGILAEFSPSVFIMENVKGILTSKVGNKEMFAAIMRDLSDPAAALKRESKSGKNGYRYTLLPIHIEEGEERSQARIEQDPSAFIIKCENHGIPQARHRVIIMGVREDLMHDGISRIPGLDCTDTVPAEDALAGLPKLRSGLSRQEDDGDEWRKAVDAERERIVRMLGDTLPELVRGLKALKPGSTLPRSSIEYTKHTNAYVAKLKPDAQKYVLNHETRGHMKTDLGRYIYCAAFAEYYARSPTSKDFPKKLAPEHTNWNSGAFADRFRVQIHTHPANTVTSHLSRDGHAFIHWDARQCRSLTVREAARLQSFPDDYVFLGNRTQQFVQVGNAVPPLIARQIARVVWAIVK